MKSVWLKDKLYCNCGYIGTDKICQDCKKEPEIDLEKNILVRIPNITKEENTKKLILTFHFTIYSRNGDKYKQKENVYLLKMNKENGSINVINEMEEKSSVLTTRNIDYVFNALFDVSKLPDIQMRIVEELFKARGVIDVNKEMFKGGMFKKAFLFVFFPNLQYFRTNRVSEPRGEEKVKVLKNAKGEIELFLGLTGHKSKKIRQVARRPEVFNTILIWGNIIKKPDNLLNFLNSLGYSPKEVKSSFFFENTGTGDYFKEGIQLIQKLHAGQEEKVWINRMVKALKKNNRNSTHKSLISYVSDIGMMYRYLRQSERNDEIAFDGDIAHLHDWLAKIEREIRQPNFTFEYTNEEKELEKKVDDKKEIILAPDREFLSTVGEKMKICVGSYHQKTKNKDCYIFVLEEKGEPKVCLEVCGENLIQAKMKYNQQPNKEYKKEIIEWCKEKRLKYENCSDIAY